MIEGEKQFDMDPAPAPSAPQQRGVDPGHPRGHHQSPGGYQPRRPARNVRQRLARPWPCRRRVAAQADTSNPITSTPRLRLRDLVSPWASTAAPIRRPVPESRRLDDLPRAGQSHDRGQVQRPWQRPGRGRQRSTGRRPEISFRPVTAPSGAASSRKWRKPRDA